MNRLNARALVYANADERLGKMYDSIIKAIRRP